MIARLRRGRGHLVWGLIAGTLVLRGFGAVLLIHQLSLGHWDAFFMIQARYGHGLHNPLWTLGDTIMPIFEDPRTRADTFPALQTCFMLFLLIVCFSTVFKRETPRPQTSFRRLIGLYVGSTGYSPSPWAPASACIGPRPCSFPSSLSFDVPPNGSGLV